MKNIKVNKQGTDLFIKISGVTESEAEFIAKAFATPIIEVAGLVNTSSGSQIDEDDLNKITPAISDIPETTKEDALAIPDEQTQTEEDSELAAILAIVNDNERIIEMGVDVFIRKCAPYTKDLLKEFDVQNLDEFIESGELRKKQQLANQQAKKLRQLTV